MNTNSNTQHPKKLSSSTIMLVTFVILIGDNYKYTFINTRINIKTYIINIYILKGVALFSLNYWHASKCSSDRSPDEIEELILTLKNRLLESESKVLI